ncbi:hypothetical protein QE152_g38376 [Popillia japonica]|uniref:Uncharacterized protein n=1 Tax=Popillia japonica TaxID=7064 RepID=A0AAW1HWU7_POPJA
MSAKNEEISPNPTDKKATQLKRFFSLDSSGTDSFRCPNYVDEHEERLPKICGYKFILKLAQLFTGIVSIGMYSTAILIIPCDEIKTRRGIMESRMTSLMFPNIVFTTFLIITSVLALGYALRQNMPEVVIRIFNVIGMILYFVSASVSGYIWRKHLYDDPKGQNVVPYVMFCGQIFTSLLNSVLYGVDVGLSIKTAWNINEK